MVVETSSRKIIRIIRHVIIVADRVDSKMHRNLTLTEFGLLNVPELKIRPTGCTVQSDKWFHWLNQNSQKKHLKQETRHKKSV